MWLAALLGTVLGFVGSIPVAGPISALVVTRGIAGRFRSAVWIAVGGAAVEALYACLAFWGFGTFLTRYPIIAPISRGVGAVVLLALGISFLLDRSEPGHDDLPRDGDDREGAGRSFLLGAWLCAINPTLIATWSAVVTMLHGSGLVEVTGAAAIPFAVGCALGIVGWFWTLIALIRRHRERFSQRALRRVVRGLGLLLVALSAWFAWRFVDHWRSPTVEDQAALFLGPTRVSSVARATSSPRSFFSTTGTS